MSIPTDLNTWSADIASATGYRVTRNPDLIDGPCLFIDTPTFKSRGMTTQTFTVPVYVIVPGPADELATDALLAMVPPVLDALQESEATPSPITLGGITFPAYVVNTTLTLTKE